MSCNYVQQPPIEDDQCAGEPAYRVYHSPSAQYWFETCRAHLADAVDEVMANVHAVIVTRV